MEVNVDLIGRDGGTGAVAELLTQGRMDPGTMRPFFDGHGRPCITVYKGGDPKKLESYETKLVNNAVLRREEWQQLDAAIVPVAQQRLVGVQDLISKGLVYNLGNAMGTTVLEWHDVSEAMEAIMSMDGVSRSANDRPEFGTHYLPIPIIHVDYEINARVLAASRNLGNPLDTIQAEYAARRVAEKLESLLFQNLTYKFGGGTIYSYTNHPDRNQVVLAKKWTDSSVTGKDILQDVMELKQTSLDALHRGPWMLYIPPAYETRMDEDYSDAKGTNTIRERLLKIGGIQEIKVVDSQVADTILLVQMTSDVVRLVRGMGIQNVQWDTEGKFITKYKVLTIQVPQIRSDQQNRSGIVHATFAA